MKAWEIYSYQHPDSTALRGTVTAERRRQIIATINRAMGWVRQSMARAEGWDWDNWSVVPYTLSRITFHDPVSRITFHVSRFTFRVFSVFRG
jgi:hypothetical protein